MCNFVCGAMSCAKLSLHWSVIHYQVTLSNILHVVRKPLLPLFFYCHPLNRMAIIND